jgi:protein arginine kinase activator
MMQCDVCKSNSATVFLTQILKGELQKVNLCEHCSKEKGVTDPTGFALAEMLWGLGEKQIVAQPREKSCPACELTQSVFRKAGRLGCAHCYEVFADQVGNLLKAMHKGTHHVGKSPPGCVETPEPPVVNRMEQLNEALKLAVAGEQYEEAARLRDEINRAANS